MQSKERNNLSFFSIIFFLLTLAGCGHQAPFREGIFTPESPPFFQDDGNVASLIQALQRHQHYLSANDVTCILSGKTIDKSQLLESLTTFQKIVELNLPADDFNRIIRENFTIFQAGGRKSTPGKMLVTGYYEPTFEGSLIYNPPYVYPLYTVPDDLVVNGNLSPYWTREEIETQNLLAGKELVFLKNRFDAFLLHIQGSGRVQLPNGTTVLLGYKGNNGHPYSSIGKLLVDRGIMKLEDVNIFSIRRYLKNNPEEVDKILYHNKRYIFFELKENKSPIGTLGEELTAGRSVAIDHNFLPLPLIGYLITRKPVLNNQREITTWIKMQRFVLPQDSGSAIKGSGRVDLFWGNSYYAEIAAGTMREEGYLYFLLKKEI